MNEEQKTIDALHKSTPALQPNEKEDLWRALEGKLSPAPAPIPSPYLSFFNSKKHMAPIALALVLMLGGTGVVAAAETSRPGDSLFVIEQKVEDIRLALASDDKKAELEAKFTAERLAELSAILQESIEEGDTKSTSTTSRANLSGDAEVKVNEAVAVTLGYVLNGSFGDDEREDFLEELSLLVDGVPVKLNGDRLRIQDTNTWVEVRGDSDDGRVEIRDGNDRVRIREKDGEIRIDTKGAWVNIFGDNDDDSDDQTDDNTDDDDRSDDNGRDNNAAFEAEADVFSNTTIVEIEINDRKTVFETSAKTREAVVLEIMSRFGVTRATVEAGLDFEVEDRASRDDDKDDDRDDDKDDDRLINVSTGLELNVGDDERD